MESEGLNKNSFSSAIGSSNNVTITRIINTQRTPSRSTCEKITNAFPKYSLDWLLTGSGEMLNENNVMKENILISPKQQISDATYKLVPVIHIDSVGGMHSANNIIGEPQYIEGYVPFVNAKEDDRAIYQSGDSMIPTIHSGSLMQIREVKGWKNFFGFGNIFVIELSDGRRITKEVSRYEGNPKDFVWCISHNPSVPDEELPKNMIVSVWKVIKVLTDKG